MYARKRKALGHFGLCRRKLGSILERATTYAKALWLSIAKVIVWLDNFNKQCFGPTNLIWTRVWTSLHSLPVFGGQLSFHGLAECVPAVAPALAAELDVVVQHFGDVCDQVQRNFVRVPPDIARGNMGSLQWRPLMLSALRVG